MSSWIFKSFRELLFLHKNNTMAILLKTASVRVSSIQIMQVRVQNKGRSVWKSRYVGDVSVHLLCSSWGQDLVPSHLQAAESWSWRWSYAPTRVLRSWPSASCTTKNLAWMLRVLWVYLCFVCLVWRLYGTIMNLSLSTAMAKYGYGLSCVNSLCCDYYVVVHVCVLVTSPPLEEITTTLVLYVTKQQHTGARRS